MLLSKDAFVRKCKRIYQEINEQTLEDHYEFMSEADMVKAGFDENLIQKSKASIPMKCDFKVFNAIFFELSSFQNMSVKSRVCCTFDMGCFDKSAHLTSKCFRSKEDAEWHQGVLPDPPYLQKDTVVIWSCSCSILPCW